MPITFAQLGSMGRLGNSLFQAASVISLAFRNNDTFVFPHWKYEKEFNIPSKYFQNAVSFDKSYTEPFFHYQEIPYSPNLNICDSYLQSWKYFDDYKTYVKQIFTPANYSINPMQGITGIHVRRTDYLKFSNCHTNLDMGYYNEAMRLIPARKYLICSDDITWCHENFIGKQFIFSEGNNEVKDFCMLMSCENVIAANSSFSWWAGYLNRNEDKKIIAPKAWFGPDLVKTHSTKDLIPEEWVQI